MKLLALSYPEISTFDLQRIEMHRSRHDRQFVLIRAHFTWVFPLDEKDEHAFCKEIKEQLRGISSFAFTVSEALVHKESFEKEHCIFLVPGKGSDQMIALHHRLYSGTLHKFLKAEFRFIPHITIGMSQDKMACKNIVDEWNKNKTSIQGMIASVEVVKY